MTSWQHKVSKMVFSFLQNAYVCCKLLYSNYWLLMLVMTLLVWVIEVILSFPDCERYAVSLHALPALGVERSCQCTATL